MAKLQKIVMLWPIRKVVTWLLVAYIRVFQDYRVNPRAKCPACGCRKKHPIRYERAYRHVIHKCSQCEALWGEKPILDVDKWELKPEDEEQVSTSLRVER